MDFTQSELAKYNKMIGSIIRHTYIPGWDREDIYQESWLYLLDAYVNYDPAKGALDTFLYVSIKLRLSNLKTSNQFGLASQYRSAISAFEIEKSKDPTLTSEKFLINTKLYKSITKSVAKYLKRHEIYPNDRFLSLNKLMEEYGGFDAPIPSTIEAEIEYEEMLEVCRSVMTPLEGKVFWDKHNGWSFDEISLKLGLDKKTTIKIYHHCKDKLKLRINDYINL